MPPWGSRIALIDVVVSHRVGRRPAFSCRRRLGHRQPYRAVDADGIVPVPHRGHRARLLEAWPKEVAGPLATDVTGVLINTRGDVLTFGVMFALYFASSGVESLRIGLNRAYDMVEQRPWWLLRIESIGYVIIGAIALLAFAFLVVLAPFIWYKLIQYVPTLEPFSGIVTFTRYATAAVVMVIALTILHLWLPAGRRSFREIAPGIVATLLLWLVGGAAFGRYLADYAFAYVTMYAGLASAMIALVFLYFCASIFIYGGELNSVISPRPKIETPPADADKATLP
jgi:membrane protein